MNEQTTLFLGPEENITVLKGIFSSKKSSAEDIAGVVDKKKGTVNNSIHDLKILNLIDGQINVTDEARNIVYDRNAKQILKKLFIAVSGNKEAVKEINSEEQINPLKAGKIFCFHTNARATKESSITQVGRLYLRWLKFLDLIENKEKEGEIKNRS
ncbi:MAG: hypothetical protein ISS13_01545 [Actinobacteria bacterium]|nr:hypothetical protein [Actinomycetota bacterium]